MADEYYEPPADTQDDAFEEFAHSHNDMEFDDFISRAPEQQVVQDNKVPRKPSLVSRTS